MAPDGTASGGSPTSGYRWLRRAYLVRNLPWSPVVGPVGMRNVLGIGVSSSRAATTRHRPHRFCDNLPVMAPRPSLPQVLALRFDRLDPHAVYAICKIRQDVFVVEQQCPYPDLDARDVDPETRHVMLMIDDALVGYGRVLDDGDTWRIGRVLLAPDARGRGWADLIMMTALDVSTGRDVVLDAQTPLTGWYATFGFEVDGAEFLEDGIPHTPMRLSR